LLDSLKEICRSNTIPLLGVAPVSRFNGSPAGHHPTDFVSGAKSVVVIGMPIMKGVLGYREMLKGSRLVPEEVRKEYLQGFFYYSATYGIMNPHLENAVLKLSFALEEEGCQTVYFPPAYGQTYKRFREMLPEPAGIFSLRHAAVRAGLGEFGLNNLVLNPVYGARVRYNCLITEADLPPTPLLEEKVCLGSDCGLCLAECGTGAISPGNPELKVDTPDQSRVWLDPVSRTNKMLCIDKRMESFCYGRCLAVCPAGQK